VQKVITINTFPNYSNIYSQKFLAGAGYKILKEAMELK